MRHFIVLYRAAGHPPCDPPEGFACQADDGDHAEEQTVNAYPGADVLWVHSGRSIARALRDYWDAP